MLRHVNKIQWPQGTVPPTYPSTSHSQMRDMESAVQPVPSTPILQEAKALSASRLSGEGLSMLEDRCLGSPKGRRVGGRSVWTLPSLDGVQ